MQVVQICFPGADQLFSDADGERQVCEAITMKVTNLTTTDMKKHHAAAMGFDGNPRPRANFVLYSSNDRFRGHRIIMSDAACGVVYNP